MGAAITQIITYQGKSIQFMATRTIQEIEKINNYERNWKIKTNKSKFKVIPIVVQKKNIIIDLEIIEFSGNGYILGMTVSRNGISKHINNIATKAEIAVHDLYRVRELSCNKKNTLNETLYYTNTIIPHNSTMHKKQSSTKHTTVSTK